MAIKRKKVSTSINATKSLSAARGFFDIPIPRETKIAIFVITASLAIFVIGSTAFAKENIFERMWRTIVTSPIDTAYGDETADGVTTTTTATTPELVSPSEGITIVGVDPVFIWEGVQGVLTYVLRVSSSTDELFEDPTKTKTIEMPTPSEVCASDICSQRVRGLSGNTAYHWKVLANSNAFSGFKSSPVRHFTTGEAPRHLFLQPKSGDNVGIGYAGGTLDYKLAVSDDLYVGGSIYQNFPTGQGEVRGFFVARNNDSYYSGNINVWPTGNLGIGTVSRPQAKLHVQRSTYAGVHGVLIDEDEPESNGNPKIELRGNEKTPYIDFTGTKLINDDGSQRDFDSRIIYNWTEKKLNFTQDGGNGYTFDNKLYVKGDVNVQTVFVKPSDHLALATDRVGLDVAELFEAEEQVEIGDLLVVGKSDRKLKKSSRPYEEEIIGIVSGSPALLFEGSQTKLGSAPNRFTAGSKPPVALSGRVPVKVSLQNGPIKAGDYLTSSSQPGIAMRATDPGAIVGIALEGYDASRGGMILAFVNVGEKNVAKEIKRLLREVQLLKAKVR